MTEKPKITPSENGPLIVSSQPSLRGTDNAEIPVGPRAALCRCGHSSKKPFCDGSHKAAGFSSAADTTKIRNTAMAFSGKVEGTPVTVSYTPVLCSHAARCVAASEALFDPSRKPWIEPSNGTMTQLLTAIGDCPSGALRLEIGTAPARHLVDGAVAISVEKNGPYHVRNIAIDAEFNGIGASQAKYVLCRCGQSSNKPFCDGTHRDVGWSDATD